MEMYLDGTRMHLENSLLANDCGNLTPLWQVRPRRAEVPKFQSPTREKSKKYFGDSSDVLSQARQFADTSSPQAPIIGKISA